MIGQKPVFKTAMEENKTPSLSGGCLCLIAGQVPRFRVFVVGHYASAILTINVERRAFLI